MSPPPLARLVASALLAGPWRVEAMIARLETFLGVRPTGAQMNLARAMRRLFSVPPRHARDALASALAQHALWRSMRGARMRKLLVDVPEMDRTRIGGVAIVTVGALAEHLGTDVGTLDALADRRGLARHAPREAMRHHRISLVPKKDGALRVLEIPKPRLRDLQRRVLDRILAPIRPHWAASGFVAGLGVLDHARAHAGKALVVRVDLRDFFSSVSAARVGAVFRALGYPDEVRRTLTALTTVATPEPVLLALPWARRAALRVPHLAQGAPTSPALANLVAYGLDVRLAAYAARLGATYGRYADDLVISGGPALVPRRAAIAATMVRIALAEGFVASPNKTHVRRAGERQLVTGLVVNVHPAVPREERERLEAILFRCVKNGPAAENREGRPDFRAWLAGKIGWVTHVRPQHGEKLARLFAQIVWEDVPGR